MGQDIVPGRSKGWTYDETAFFITEKHEQNVLENDNLPHIGIEIVQNSFPHYEINIENKSFINSVGLYKIETEAILKIFYKLFNRIG